MDTVSIRATPRQYSPFSLKFDMAKEEEPGYRKMIHFNCDTANDLVKGCAVL